MEPFGGVNLVHVTFGRALVCNVIVMNNSLKHNFYAYLIILVALSLMYMDKAILIDLKFWKLLFFALRFFS